VGRLLAGDEDKDSVVAVDVVAELAGITNEGVGGLSRFIFVVTD